MAFSFSNDIDVSAYMFLVNVLRNVLLILLPVSVTLTTYLYLYPVFHFCAFPDGKSNSNFAYSNTLLSHISPSYDESLFPSFRLLALGDPQLEGDTSIPDAFFPHWSSLLSNAMNRDDHRHSLLQRVRHSLHDLIDLALDDVPWWLEGYRKRLDLFGNDFYLAHIYRTLRWWARPTHISVLGDLLGSQWIDDREFRIRSERFWNRVFKDGTRLNDELMAERSQDEDPLILTLGEDGEAWSRKIINIAGNHDIGYAGDLDHHSVKRFEEQFGKVNYELRFRLPEKAYNTTDTKRDEKHATNQETRDGRQVPELRIVVLNSMNLDTPAGAGDIQDATYDFLNRVIQRSHPVEREAVFTLLLTHIPLYKDEGICVDPPFFDFWQGEYNNGIREQNQLSRDVSNGILEGIFGMSGNPEVDGRGIGRRGLVINGHDHEGCDTYHYIRQQKPPPPVPERKEETTCPITITSPYIDPRDLNPMSPLSSQPPPQWSVLRTQESLPVQGRSHENMPGIREVTLRAMMGDYGGNAGLLSLWFDKTSWEWKYDFSNCALGTQHLWWAVHIIDLIAIAGIQIYLAWKLLIHFGIVDGVEIRWQTQGSRAINTVNGFSRQAVQKGQDGRMSVKASNGMLNVPTNTEAKKSLRKKKSRTKLNGSSNQQGTESTPLSSVFEHRGAGSE